MGDKNSDKIVIDYPQDTGVGLGQGWDIKTSQKKDVVGVVFAQAQAMPGQTKDMKIVKVSDQSSLMASVGISAEAQYKSVANKVKGRADFSLDLKAIGIYQSFASWAKVENGLLYAAPAPEDKAEEISAFFDKGKTTSEMLSSLGIHTLQKNPSEYTADKSVHLTSKAHELAKKNINEFYRRYGDSFVSEIYGGAEISAALIFTETSREASAKLSAQVECSGWGTWEANGSLKTSMDAYSKNSQLKITYHQTGGAGNEIATNPDDFITVIKNLPKLAEEAPVYTRIGLTRYDSLPDWPGEPMEGEVTPYSALLRRYFEYSSLYDDITYILGHKNEFLLGRGVTEDSLELTQDELLKGMNEIKDILPKCAEMGGAACNIPEAAKKPDYDSRVRMPIMLNYTPETNIFTSEDDLREQISNRWIKDISHERHKIGQDGLTNKQIDDYTSKIEVTKPPQVIYLQHAFTRKYLSRFDRKSSSYIEAGKNTPDVFCEFSVKVLSPNKIALIANNGKYLGRVNRKNPLDHKHRINSIEPVKTKPSVYCEFGVTFLANNNVVFMADNGKYWRNIGTNWPIIEASGDHIDERCEFLIIDRSLSLNAH